MMTHLGGPESPDKIAERHLRFQQLGEAGTGRTALPARLSIGGQRSVECDLPETRL